MTGPAPSLDFRRRLGGRIASALAVLVSAALLGSWLTLASRPFAPGPTLILVVMFVGSVLAAAIEYGDRIRLTSEELRIENRWLPLVRLKGSRIRWEDVVDVRESRKSILILTAADGRRVVVDSVDRYAEARTEIARRTGGNPAGGDRR